MSCPHPFPNFLGMILGRIRYLLTFSVSYKVKEWLTAYLVYHSCEFVYTENIYLRFQKKSDLQEKSIFTGTIDTHIRFSNIWKKVKRGIKNHVTSLPISSRCQGLASQFSFLLGEKKTQLFRMFIISFFSYVLWFPERVFYTFWLSFHAGMNLGNHDEQVSSKTKIGETMST